MDVAANVEIVEDDEEELQDLDALLEQEDIQPENKKTFNPPAHGRAGGQCTVM